MSSTSVDVLMITHNRPQYTARSLEALVASAEADTRVWIWQNGTDVDTVRIVQQFSDHPRVQEVYYSPENKKLAVPTNWIFEKGSSRFIAKVDDDCVVSPDWISKLRDALLSWPKLGVSACWHFQPSDLDLELAAKKIVKVDDRLSILQNNWVQGSGIMFRRSCVEKLGPITNPNFGFTHYCEKIGAAGWNLGWVLPIVTIDHMDDPHSPNCRLKSESDFQANPPLSATFGDVRSLSEWKERVRWMAREVQKAPIGNGLRARCARLVNRLREKLRRTLGLPPPWRVKAKTSNSLRD